jgi:ribonuclease HI
MTASSPARLTIFTDGGARGNPGPAAYGIYVVDDQGSVVFQDGQVLGEATNNEAEYQAFLASLKWLSSYLESNPVSGVEWKLDSMLVVKQLLKEWKLKEARMAQLATECWQLLNAIALPYRITHVPRELNRHADMLVNAALDGKPASLKHS